MRGSFCWNIFHISFCCRCLIWRLNRGRTSSKPTHYLPDHSDFKFLSYFVLFERSELYFESSTRPAYFNCSCKVMCLAQLRSCSCINHHWPLLQRSQDSNQNQTVRIGNHFVIWKAKNTDYTLIKEIKLKIKITLADVASTRWPFITARVQK